MVKVIGENETAQRTRAYLAEGDVYVVEHSPLFTFKILEGSRDLACAVVDGVDSPLEARFVSLLTEVSPAGRVVLARKGGNQDDRALVITVPARPDERHAAALAILRVCLQLAGRKRRWLPAWLGLVLVLAARSAFAGEGGYMSPRAKAGIKTAFARAVATSGQIQGGTVDQGAPGLSPWLVTFSGVSHIICDSGCGSPPATADSTAFTAGTTNVTPIAGVFDDTLANMTAGTYGAQRFTKQRAAHSNLRDANGNAILTTSPSNTLGISIIDPISPTDIVRVSGGGFGVWLNDQFGNALTVGQTDPASNARGVAVRDPILPTWKAGQATGAVNTVQFDENPGRTLPTNHDYTTPRATNFRAMKVSLEATNGLVLGENGSSPLLIGFAAGSSGSVKSFTANGQSYALPASSADGLMRGSYIFHITGTFVGTIEFQGRISSADVFSPLTTTNMATGASATTTTTTGFYVAPSSNLWEVRLMTTAWTSGQADFTDSTSPEVMAHVNATPVFANVTDGTNTAVVRGGASAPSTADAALVVGISPNSVATLQNQQQNASTINANGQGISLGTIAQKHGIVVFYVTGIWTGTLTFQGRVSTGGGFADVSAVNLATGAVGTTTTANGQFAVIAGGYAEVQIASTAWTSGTASILQGASALANAVSLTTPVAVGSSALPAGAATSTNQSTEIASLASIDSKIPTQIGGGQPVYIINPAKLPAPFRCNALRKTNCS